MTTNSIVLSPEELLRRIDELERENEALREDIEVSWTYMQKGLYGVAALPYVSERALLVLKERAGKMFADLGI